LEIFTETFTENFIPHLYSTVSQNVGIDACATRAARYRCLKLAQPGGQNRGTGNRDCCRLWARWTASSVCTWPQ